MTVSIIPYPHGEHLQVEGTYKKGEDEVGLPESFEISQISTQQTDISDLLEWAASRGKYGDILKQIEELCLESIHN